jgi:hypothetical protein
MHTNLNVSVLEFNRRSVRPHFEFAQSIAPPLIRTSLPLAATKACFKADSIPSLTKLEVVPPSISKLECL